MHLYMQTLPAAGGAVPRYCRIALEQDLLGGWTLYRESGTEGGRATLKREVYLDRDAALAAFERARDAQIKRGFRVMITQGVENAHG
ncbi:MAG TPA: WGR domain-containing protein [Rhodanobacteraceae bacterium]